MVLGRAAQLTDWVSEALAATSFMEKGINASQGKRTLAALIC